MKREGKPRAEDAAGVAKPRYSAFIDQHGGDVTGNRSGVTAKAALRSMVRDGEAEADVLKRLCNGRAQNRRRGKAGRFSRAGEGLVQ